MFIFGLLFLDLLALLIGKRLAPHSPITHYVGVGVLVLLSSLIVVLSIVYYVAALTTPILWTVFLALVVTCITLLPSLRDVWRDMRDISREFSAYVHTHHAVMFLFVVFLCLVAASLTILARSPILDSVRSPWDKIPWQFFILFFATACTALFVFYKSRSAPYQKIQTRVLQFLLFIILSVAWIAFPLGYGFDSFIHQATEKVIAVQGFIIPKPFYYIGQYSLVVFLSRILFVSVEWIDKLLVPLLAALFIPWALLAWFRNNHSDQNVITSAVFGIFLLPFVLAQFTITTPQAFANLLLIILIFGIGHTALGIQLLLATATLLIHPLAGIPAFIFLTINKIKTKNYWLLVTGYSLFALVIPATFLLASQLSPSVHVTWTPEYFLPWLRSIDWAGIYRENRFNAPLDLLYFYGFNIKNLFWFFVVTAFVEAPRLRSGTKYIQSFLVLIASYVIMRGFLSFSFLINYEQADYSRRVLEIAHFFLLPFFFFGIRWWFNVLEKRLHWVLLPLLALLALLITASLFFTYPQNVDRYAVHHGYNTSAADITAVQWIEIDARGTPYIVLANQAVSAAAVREFGFKKYYRSVTSNQELATSIFFYPIPTGSPLYQDYLDMVYTTPSRAIIERAMDRVGVDRAYFVLNRYWADFERLKKETTETTRDVINIDDRVLIFSYKRDTME